MISTSIKLFSMYVCLFYLQYKKKQEFRNWNKFDVCAYILCWSGVTLNICNKQIKKPRLKTINKNLF